MSDDQQQHEGWGRGEVEETTPDQEPASVVPSLDPESVPDLLPPEEERG